ncbi:aryl-sulfate sulfotransferase [uncultured Mailhella sp.]|uniref:aryl-sulfate sulfotransferase n=1 Tax=uncultured Mailhella sp. TaxID=1981031 RepID=UPI0025F9582D|nr:aryl-sulfate sulfotransferase [uncultured Mailhella sp.]
MSIELKQITHIIDAQYAAEQAMLAECRNGDYGIETPYVKLNPYLIAPLTALVYFKTPQATTATVRVKGKEEAGDISFTFPAAEEHFLPVYGLYADTANTVEITLGDGTKSTLTIQTEKAPESVHLPISIETTASYMDGNLMFLSPSSPANLAAYDYRGDVRWFITLNFSFDLKRVKNGRLLMGTHRLLMPPYHTTGVFEFGMIGKIYKEFRIPGGSHHDQLEMEDGNLLILTQDPPRGTVEDMCVLVDRNTGAILKSWDYQKALPQNVGGSGSQDEHDWFHNNSVWYDKKTNTLTLSGRHQDAVINLDYETGKLNWIIGDPEGWPEDMQKYFFKPVGDLSKFDWQYEQHAAVVLPDGDIMCFDNGHWRAKKKENYLPAKDNFSRGVRYHIDTEKMEIEQVWQYGKERGSEFFSCYISNVEYYGEGHYLVHSGGTGTYKGEPCNRPPVQFRGEDEQYVHMEAITVEIKDDTVMYEMHVPGNYYRAEKMPLYCKEDVLTFGKGQILGTLGVTETFDTVPDMEDGGLVPDKYNIKMAQEVDRLVMKGTFEKGQLVMLLLEGESTHAYFVPTTKRPFLAMCVGTFLESDDRSVEFPVSFEGLSGTFHVSLIIDEGKYDTGITLTI